MWDGKLGSASLRWGESHLKANLVSRLILIVMLCLVSMATARGDNKRVLDRGCIAFVHVTVVDPSSKGLQADMTVIVCGERIRSVKGAQVHKYRKSRMSWMREANSLFPVSGTFMSI